MSAGSASAQVAAPTPAPTPTPNPTYSDRALHYAPPPGYVPLMIRHIPSAELPGPVVVAAWGRNFRQENQKLIEITLRPYTESTHSFRVDIANQLRDKINGIVIINQGIVKTSNGMPAYFLKIITGSGFTRMVIRELAWSDGVRGVQLSIASRVGMVSNQEALRALERAYAVRYPQGQP